MKFTQLISAMVAGLLASPTQWRRRGLAKGQAAQFQRLDKVEFERLNPGESHDMRRYQRRYS